MPAKSAHLSTQIPPSIPDLAQAEPMDTITTAEYVLSTPIPLITLPEVAMSKIPNHLSFSISSEASADLTTPTLVNDLLDKSYT